MSTSLLSKLLRKTRGKLGRKLKARLATLSQVAQRTAITRADADDENEGRAPPPSFSVHATNNLDKTRRTVRTRILRTPMGHLWNGS